MVGNTPGSKDPRDYNVLTILILNWRSKVKVKKNDLDTI